MSQRAVPKTSLTAGAPKTEWDPDLKESWHLGFEKEPVNDKRWSCIVTAAVPTEVQNQEYIQLYSQCVSQGLRKAIKIISMDDVIRLLRGSSSDSKNKKDSFIKNGKDKKEKKLSDQDLAKKSEAMLKTTNSPFFQIVDLAAKYAVVSDNECKLPPDLMACVLKYLILKLKDENCLQKKIDVVRQRKIREANLRAKFIRNLKLYEAKEKEVVDDRKSSDSALRLDDPINDEPVDGPDLYILLVDFYDLSVFPELKKINVLFLAILEISVVRWSGLLRDSYATSQKLENFGRKKSLISSFWEKHNLECNNLENVDNYKDIATVKYQLTVESSDTNIVMLRIFNELSWIQYSVYIFYRQHQKYLQELYVQRLIVSMQPLNLSKCVVYNKLCDAVITGGALTPLLVLYAMIEQVVAGVPETNSVDLDYQTPATDFFLDDTEELESLKKKKKKKKQTNLVTPCLQCRDKKYENVCEKIKESSFKSQTLERGEWSQITEEFNAPLFPSQNQNLEETTTFSPEYIIPESLLDQAISEKETEKDYPNQKKWEAPSLCFFGDSIFLQTSHCQPRFFTTETLVERFLKNSDLVRIWEKYPESPPEDQAFYNFHFFLLRRISENSEDLLKLQIYFLMLMKLVGIATSFTYKGDDENLSDMEEENADAEVGRVKFNRVFHSNIQSDFATYFNKTFIREVGLVRKEDTERMLIEVGPEEAKESFENTDFQLLKKTRFIGSLSQKQTNPSCFPIRVKRAEVNPNSDFITPKTDNHELMALYALLDCIEISSLTQPYLISNKEDFTKLVQNFNFYEKFEPYIMIQRLLDAQNDFNTTQCSYFPLTDTVLIIMFDDYDHRGVSYTKTTQILPTPVRFRDFYSYVYQEIVDWLVEEIEQQHKFVKQCQEREKAEIEEMDSEYLNKLQDCYNHLSPEEKKRFLETDLDNVYLELDVTEKELKDLPLKHKSPCPDKFSFVATNFMDLRVEFTKKIHEFKSLDGTQVNFKIENWLYAPSSLLTVTVKLLNFYLYYNQWLEQEKIETSFTFKTKSDIIFSFYKNDPEEKEAEDEEEKEDEEEEEENGGEEEKEKRFNYNVTISWPTGLLIQPVTLDTTTYIKQSYLNIYRKGWDIQEEASRNYVRNGQVVIFNESGGYDILCPSGTKYRFINSNPTPRYEVTSTTGEVWEVLAKQRCKNRKNLLTTMKVFIGVDTKAHEIFYKREDGVYFLLWQNGKLVTSYPDGTKITTIPDFDENEISLEWAEEEKTWLRENQSKSKLEQSTDKSINRSSIKNNISFGIENDTDDNFVSISCSYLIEHPKYSTVYYNSEEDNIRLTMPEDLTMYVYPGGNYVLKKQSSFLKVCDTIVEVCKECIECKTTTTVNLFLYENEILCKCVDFLNNVFLLYRNGKTIYEKSNEGEGEEEHDLSTLKNCIKNHNRSVILKQRCFAFERDLSGVEFLHADSIAMYSNELSKNTFFDVNTDDPSNLCHTFTCPHYKVGCENWMMKYENEDDSLPSNLKKKDLKEMGSREVPRNLFKYPFPAKHKCGDRHQTNKFKENIKMPKLIVARTIWSWPDDPDVVIEELKKNIEIYENNARDIWSSYKNRKVTEFQSRDSTHAMMRLRKIALTLNQSLHMYPHLCSQSPSTEKEVHYFGHFINSMGVMKSHFKDLKDLPDCKQIPLPLPRSSDFPSIYEENESPKGA